MTARVCVFSHLIHGCMRFSSHPSDVRFNDEISLAEIVYPDNKYGRLNHNDSGGPRSNRCSGRTIYFNGSTFFFC